jgi:hypothetical protein
MFPPQSQRQYMIVRLGTFIRTPSSIMADISVGLSMRSRTFKLLSYQALMPTRTPLQKRNS